MNIVKLPFVLPSSSYKRDFILDILGNRNGKSKQVGQKQYNWILYIVQLKTESKKKKKEIVVNLF